MLKRLLPLLVLILGLVGCQEAAIPATSTPDPLLVDNSVKLITLAEDGPVKLEGGYYPPPDRSTKRPALLILNLGESETVWLNFAQQAQEDGFAVLIVNLLPLQEGGLEARDQDINTTVDWLLDRSEIDAKRIGLVAANRGTTLAFRAASRYEANIQSMALLSPGLDTLELMNTYGRRGLMLVASERDVYAAEAARTLNSRALGQHQLQIYPGAAQGTALLSEQAGLTPMLLAWFKLSL